LQKNKQGYRSKSISRDKFVGLSDEMVVSAALTGNQSAYTELFKRYEYQLSVKFGRSISDQDTINDLVQKTFINAFEKLSGFRLNGRFSSWIYKIATNLLCTEIKCIQRSKKLDRFDQHIHTPHRLALRSKFLNPEEELCIRDMIGHAESAITELPKEDRDVLLMRVDEDLPYSEIVNRTGYHLGVVKMRIHRARQTVSKKIGMKLS
jgi:RNA polymerase sigma-70 factor, ECF subfamily